MKKKTCCTVHVYPFQRCLQRKFAEGNNSVYPHFLKTEIYSYQSETYIVLVDVVAEDIGTEVDLACLVIDRKQITVEGLRHNLIPHNVVRGLKSE